MRYWRECNARAGWREEEDAMSCQSRTGFCEGKLCPGKHWPDFPGADLDFGKRRKKESLADMMRRLSALGGGEEER